MKLLGWFALQPLSQISATQHTQREREIQEEERSPEKMKREVKSNFAFCKINFNQNL